MKFVSGITSNIVPIFIIPLLFDLQSSFVYKGAPRVWREGRIIFMLRFVALRSPSPRYRALFSDLCIHYFILFDTAVLESCFICCCLSVCYNCDSYTAAVREWYVVNRHGEIYQMLMNLNHV